MLARDPHVAEVAGFHDSPLQDADCLLRPGAAVRTAAHLLRGKLDEDLIEGADPTGSRLLAARAAQLSSRCTRSRIADGLERLALSADGPPSRVRVLPQRVAARANRSRLLELAGLLRRDGPVYARGVAMLEVIVTDGTGPAYTDRRGSALAGRLDVARATLTG